MKSIKFLLLILAILAIFARASDSVDESVNEPEVDEYEPEVEVETEPEEDQDNETSNDDGHNYDHDHSKCGHDEMEHKPEFLDVDEEIPTPEGRILASYPRMRLYPYFGTLTGGSSSFRSYAKYDLIPPVISYFENALRVKYPLRSALKVSKNVRYVCDTRTPSILQTTGVAADHFVFFTTGSYGSYVATSTYCFLSTGIKRPIVSKVMLNTRMIQVPGSDLLLHERNMYTLLHEMTHSFGFSTSLFPYWLDSNGYLRRNHLRKVKLQGYTRTVLDVPSLTSRVRRHYGCSSLPGAYLENNGGSGTAGSHFERRHFLFDIMTSGELSGAKLSEFTLAALEGSGWYSPDYNYAEPYHFGAGQGCGFVTGSCSSANSRFDEFCSSNEERGCSYTGRGGGKCRSDANSDGCKFYNPSINFDCENPSAWKSAGRLASAQVFGRTAGSKCFGGTLADYSGAGHLSFCFTYDCNGSGSSTTLDVLVGRRKVTCYREGRITVPGYDGSLDCPDPLHFCSTIGRKYCPRNCMGRGNCYNGQCRCYKGYKGVDCALRY